MLSVWAIDPSRVRRGLLAPLECTAVLRDSDLGTWQVAVPMDDPLSQALADGWRVLIQDDAQTVISGRLLTVEGALKERTLTVSGVSELQALKDRIVYPSPGLVATAQTAEATYKQSGPAETVIRDLVHVNAGTGAISARQAQGFTVTASQGRGKTVTVNARFTSVLEEATKLARAGGIVFDAVQEQSGIATLRFRTPRDLSRSVRFMQENGGLEDGTWTLNAATVTAAIVGGQGEGTYRNVREYTRAGTRLETWIDEGSTDDDAEIKQAADEALDEGVATATASIKVRETTGLRLGTDFDIGDTVTAVLGGAVVSQPVRQAEITWDEYGRTVDLTLGDQADEKTPAWVAKVRDLSRRMAMKETR